MKEIPLTQGLVAAVDDEDFPRLSDSKWHAARSSGRGIYAKTHLSRNKLLYMHRVILCALPGEFVDHINHDTLDNRRSNLRLCTAAGSARNTIHKLGNSGFRGVRAAGGRFRAVIRFNGDLIHLGLFGNPVDAAVARDAAARRLHGEFAILNFPDAA